MRVIFMGTPDFAVPTFQALAGSRHQLVAAVTQPDKAKGRSGKLMPSPVKEAAAAADIPVLQPEKVSDKLFLEQIRELNPDVIVVAAFGQKLTPEFLALPAYGCINVHASLLPKLRGAAPIQWSVIQGDKESGITVMQMEEGIDTGDILLAQSCPLEPDETGGSLSDKLSHMGGPLILQVLEMAEEGSLHPVPQDHGQHTYVKMLRKSMGEMDFREPAVKLERLIRGLNPWPSAYTYLGGKMLKIWRARVTEGQDNEEPGTVIEVTGHSFTVQTGDGGLEILLLQLEGKKRMDTEAFLRGCALQVGTRLGK